MRGLLILIATAALAGCAHAPDPGVSWSRTEDADQARLVAAGPDGAQLILECAPHTGVVDLTVIGRAGDPAVVTLRSGKLESRHAGAGVADADGAMDIQAQVSADDPVLARFADTGELSVALGRRKIRPPNGFAPAHDFLAACRK